ncbi:MAG: FAD-dependent oxidoreductase [Bryobacteraceae bacterium]|nr:FAD-dependent oxidoreductase [Solibacteraceae bacterium]MCO5353216.1 FAD-dependent oxidoreductase [Bryobacteraceae bacterium]
MRIVILGGGPAGLGAAWRLHELGHSEWKLIESSPYAGGLACSFRDAAGFTWDIGGHINFSHYDYFDRFLDALIPASGWLHHQRQSYIRIRDRFIPYPFQNNIALLPPEDTLRCLRGLLRLHNRPAVPVAHFDDWIEAGFGEGIAELFLRPYNRKVWAHPLDQLSATWVGERVATVDLDRVLASVVHRREDAGWGPNSTFRYPLRGGTGAVWTACAQALPSTGVNLGLAAEAVNLDRREVVTSDGTTHRYDALISTVPLPDLCVLAGDRDLLRSTEGRLLSAATHAVGIGLRGRAPRELAGKNWLYFPGEDCCFYRVTVLSNYSPHNVPEGGDFWSLLCETSESTHRPAPADPVASTIEGLVRTGLLAGSETIVSRWHFRAPYGYPVPGLRRDEALGEILPALDHRGVYSRGRFGAWKYEVSNQDHTFMQGVEVIDRILRGKPEQTLPFPAVVNAPRS